MAFFKKQETNNPMDERVNLGDEVEDTITGFRGIAVGVTKWIHGCRRITIQPQELKDGEPVGAHTFDEPQIRVIQPEIIETTGTTGGPGPEPTRAATPPRR